MYVAGLYGDIQIWQFRPIPLRAKTLRTKTFEQRRVEQRRVESRARLTAVATGGQHAHVHRRIDSCVVRRTSRSTWAHAESCEPVGIRCRVRPSEPNACRRTPWPGPSVHRFPGGPTRSAGICWNARQTQPTGECGTSPSLPLAPPWPHASPIVTRSFEANCAKESPATSANCSPACSCDLQGNISSRSDNTSNNSSDDTSNIS